MAFSREQAERYARHFVLKEIGVPGQKRLLQSSVLVIGAGALGSSALLYLAAAEAAVKTVHPAVSAAEIPTKCTKTISMERRKSPRSMRNTAQSICMVKVTENSRD